MKTVQIQVLEESSCPFCGTQIKDREEFVNRTGIEPEAVAMWNGELKTVLKLGQIVMEGHKRTGQDIFDKERLLELLKNEYKVIDDKKRELEEWRSTELKGLEEKQQGLEKYRKELDEERRKVADEQKEALNELEEKKITLIEQTEKLGKQREELVRAESMKLPDELMKQFGELQKVAHANDMEIKELIQKLIHNAKAAGTMQETQLTARLRSINTGDTITHLGGPGKEDILITVREDKKELGRIRFDSKNVEKWDPGFIRKMQKYVKASQADFGIIATTVMPKSAATCRFFWEGGNIIVAEEKVAEAVYLMCRYLIVKSAEYAADYDRKAGMLKENQKKLDSVKRVLDKASFKQYLTAIAEAVSKDNENIDQLETYMTSKARLFRASNSEIMRQVHAAMDNNDELQRALAVG